ncbi:unnamed protein product, partial [Ectocarpus sp. 13 AM-2016]
AGACRLVRDVGSAGQHSTGALRAKECHQDEHGARRGSDELGGGDYPDGVRQHLFYGGKRGLLRRRCPGHDLKRTETEAPWGEARLSGASDGLRPSSDRCGVRNLSSFRARGGLPAVMPGTEPLHLRPDQRVQHPLLRLVSPHQAPYRRRSLRASLFWKPDRVQLHVPRTVLVEPLHL